MGIDAILHSFGRFGVKLGLGASQQLLQRLGNPQEQVPFVHVAGSNGKGSVCAYLASVLTAAGYRVGRYTSPHLVDWCERIQVNGQAIAPDVLETVLHQVVAATRPDDPPTQFEVITAAAWLYFAQQQVDVAVMEVGLGGRLDATNVCDRPLVSVITSISREHWQRLGPTLADIAYEKAGILKPDRPAVVGQLPAAAQAVVAQRAAELHCPLTWVQPAEPVEPQQARYAGIQYHLPLAGAIQLENSAIALEALLNLRQQGWTITDAAMAEGIAQTRWPGRLQWFTWQGQSLLIDGAHNPASAQVLRQYVDSLPPAPVHWVMGMLATKDHADVLAALLRPGDSLYVVPVPEHESAQPEELAHLAQQICPELKHCQTWPELQPALTTALQNRTPTEPVVLCGSLYLIGSFFQQLAN